MKKRALALLLTATMALPLLSGCTGAGNSPDGAAGAGQQAGEDAGDEIVKMTMLLGGEQQDDHPRIVGRVNEILNRDMGIELELTVVPWGSAPQQKQLMLTSGEPLDLMYTPRKEVMNYMNNGQIIDLNDLIDEYGVNIKEVWGNLAKSVSIGDFVGAVPNVGPVGNTPCIGMRKDMVDKYGIDVDRMFTYEDLDEVFALIKENEPGISVLHVASDQPPAKYLARVDFMIDDLAVLDDAGLGSTEVIPITESVEYRKTLDLLHDWYKKGYINQDAATSTVGFESAFRAGDNFGAIMIWHPVSPSKFGGVEVVYAMLSDEHLVRSGATGTHGFAIPVNCKDPVKAFQLLDYLHGSPEIHQLLNWGEEDIDWVYVDKEKNIVNFPAGIDDSNAPYHPRYHGYLPNQFLPAVWEGMNAWDTYDKIKAWNGSGTHSQAFGFAYNPVGLESELTALTNVMQKYMVSLETGSVDPEEYLPQFAQELEQNGIDKIVEEKQKQFDAWLASR